MIANMIMEDIVIDVKHNSLSQYKFSSPPLSQTNSVEKHEK